MSKSPNAEICQQVMGGTENPFWALEAAQEHCNSMWHWWMSLGHEASSVDGRRIITGSVGDFDFELHTIEQYLTEVFNQLAAIEPDLYAASEGDTIALQRLCGRLSVLKELYQERGDSCHVTRWKSHDR